MFIAPLGFFAGESENFPTVTNALPNNSSDSGWIDMTDNAILWHFDETSGNFTDSSGNSKTGSATNVNRPPGIHGKMASFASSGTGNSTNRVETSYSLRHGSTVMMWMRGTTGRVWCASNAGSYYELTLAVSSTSTTLNFSGLTGGSITLNTNIGDNEWHHVACVFGESETKIYVDGALDSSSTTADWAAWAGYLSYRGYPQPNEFIVGCRATRNIYGSRYSAPFDGKVDECAVFERELYAWEIENAYSGYKNNSTPATISATQTNNGTDQITVNVSITDVDSVSAGWAYKLNSAFGSVGSAHGGTVGTGTSVALTSLAAQAHTVYVALFDSNGNIVANLIGDPSSTSVSADLTPMASRVLVGLNRYFHFNGDLSDYSGNNNNASMGAGTATYGADKWNQKAFIPKDNAIVNSGHPMISTDTTYSIAAWVYSDTNKTGAILCSNSVHYSTWGPGGITVNFGGTTANSSGFNYRYSNSNVTPYSCAVPALATGQWHHIVAVQNGSTMQTWVNGVKQTEITNATNAPFATSNPMYIGGYKSNQSGAGGYGGEATDVKIDEFAYWTKSLTQVEIEWMWNSGAGRHLVTPAATIDASVAVNGSDFTITATIGDPGSTATGGWAFGTSPLGAVGQPHGRTAVSSGNTATITSASDGSYTLYYGLIDSSGNVLVKDQTTFVVGLTTGLVLQHDCDDATADAGTSNATLTNVTAAAVLGRNAWNFSGQTSKVILDSNRPSFSANGNWTYSLWFYNLKSNSGNTAWRTALRANSAGNHPIIVGYNNNNLGYYVSGTGFADSGFDMVHTDYTGWNHIVAVGDGSTTKYYVNGSLVGSVNYNPAIDIYSIGNYQSDNQQFADAIGDVRIWNRSLGASDISELYTSSFVLSDGRNAQYTLDFNSNDGIGSNNLTETGTWAYPQNGNYRSADTTSGYLATTSTVNVDQGTISLWAKHDGGHTYYGNDYKGLVIGGANPNSKLSFGLLNNKIRLQYYNGSSWSDTRDTLAISAGSWNHYTIAFDLASNEIKVYLNGSLRLTYSSFTQSMGSMTLHYGISSSSMASAWYLNGELDDIQTWNRPLTASQVTSLNSAGRTQSVSLTTGLTHRWSLDSDGAPAVGSGTFTASNGVTHVTANGRTYASFPNRNSSYWINSPYIDLPNTYTMSFWFKDMNSRSGAQGTFLMATSNHGGSNGTSSGTVGYDIAVYYNDELGAWGPATSGASHSHRTTGFAMVNTDYQGWHHMAMVMDNGTATYYVDGVKAGNSVSYYGQQKIQIFGSLSNHNYNFAQAYDDFRLWDRALAASEILELKATTHVIEDDLVAHYELDGDADAAVGSNNGTVSGATFATVGGKQHADFDGSGDTINFGDANEFEINATDSRTFSGWFNFDSSMTGITTILTKRSNSGTNKGYVLWRHSNGNVYFQLTNSSTIAGVDSQTSVSLNAWHHIAITIDRANSEMKMYVDGVLKDTENISSVPDLSSTNAFIMGWGDNIDDYHGLIDDYRVWTRSLSATEISSLNSTGRPGIVYTAQQVNGYYPLYASAAGAQQHTGGNGTYHTHVFGGVTYYMPNGLSMGTTQFHGTYGQVAGYNFDSANANDTIGSNNGTATGATFATTGGRTVIEYDGSGDYVTIPYSADLQPQTEITVATWIKFDSAGNWYDFPVFQAGTGTNNEYAYSMWRFRDDGSNSGIYGKLAWRLRTSNGHAECLTNFIPNTNQWYHLVGTYDGTDLKLYVNGSLHTTASQTGNINQYANQPLYLNKQLRYPESGTTVSGKINGSQDDVRIYSRAIPASEVQYIYESTIQLEDGMVAKYTLDSNANDSVGTNNGTVTGATLTAGYASFDGNDEISIPHDVNHGFSSGYFSVSKWIKTTSTGMAVVWIKGYGSSADATVQLQVNHSTAPNKAFVWFRNNDGSVVKALNSTTTVNDGNWHHILVVRNNGSLKLYVDGTLEDSETGLTGTFTPTQPLLLGYWDHQSHSPNYYYTGDIDDLRVWSRSLSASEATSLNSAGREVLAFDKFGYYPLYHTATAANAASEGNGSNHSHVLGGVTYYMPNGIAGGVGGGNQFHGTYGQVAGYNFDSANANDSIGSNNGTAANITYGTAGGRTYAEANASNNRIDLGNTSALNFGTGDFSVSAWVYMDSIPSGNGANILSKGMTSLSSPQYNGFALGSYNGLWRWFVGGNGSYKLITTAATTGKWAHLTATRSGTELKLYVDGSLATSDTDSTTRDTNNTYVATMFSHNNGTWYDDYFDGKLDDVRAWNRALPADEVANLYSSTQVLEDGMTAKYALDYDANDSVGTSNGTVTGATFTSTATGKRSVSFDGTSDFIQISDPAALAGSTWTISQWIKTGKTSGRQDFLSQWYTSGGTSTASIGLGTNNGSLKAYYRGNSGGSLGTLSGPNVADDNWHHIVYVKSATEVRIYVDGSSEANASFSDSINSTSDLILGAWGTTAQSFAKSEWYDGEMDDLRIWSRDLSATEVSSLNSAGREDSRTLAEGLLGTWNFDSANANDSVGSINGTANNVTFATAGGRTYADFSGSSSYIDLGHSSNMAIGTSDFTISAWVKPDNISMAFAQIFGSIITGSASPSKQGIHLAIDNGDLRFNIGGNNTMEPTTYALSAGFAGVWNHVVATRSGTEIKMYINGVLVVTNTVSSVYNIESTTSWHKYGIGAYSYNNSWYSNYAGAIDDTRVWTRALAAAEVANLHSSTQLLTDGQVAKYALDYDANDSIGSSNGTASNITFAADGAKRHAVFERDNSATISVPSGVATAITGDHTISAWLRLETINGYYTILTANQEGLGLIHGKPGFLSGGGTLTFNNALSALNTNTWYHIAMTKSGSTKTLYVNGSAQANGTNTSTSWGFGSNVQIGRGSWADGANGYLDGDMDDHRVWSRALSASEISSLYSAGREDSRTLTTGLTHRWSLDSDGTAAVGTQALTAANSAAHATAGGRSYGTLPNFNSTFYSNPKIALSSSYTMSLWFKDLKDRSSATGNWLMVVGHDANGTNGAWGSGGTTAYDASIYTNDELGAWDTAWRSSGYQMTYADYNGTGWHMLTMVYDGSQMTYYINGSKVGNSITYNSDNALQVIGSWTNYNYAFADQIDDPRIWNRTLEAEEVTDLYNTTVVLEDGMVAKYVFDYNANDSKGSNNGTITNAAWANSGSYRFLDFDGTGDYVEVPNATALNSATGSVSLWFKTDASNIQDAALIGKNDGTNTSKTGWQLYIDDNYPALQVKDSIASFSYAGISENPSFVYSGQHNSKAQYLTGALVPQGDSTTFTVNAASVTGTPEMIIAMYNPNNHNQWWASSGVTTLTTGNNTINYGPFSGNVFLKYVLRTANGSSATVNSISIDSTALVNANHANATRISGSSTVNDNSWHHLAATYKSGGEIKLYLDGSPIASASSTIPFTVATDALRIGEAVHSSWNGFDGQIDDVKIWNKQLIDAEVAALYSEGQTPLAIDLTQSKTGHWRLNTNAYDTQGSNNGTVSGATFSEVSGKSFASFDGSNDSITIPHDANHGFSGTTASWSTWIKTTQTSNGMVMSKSYNGSGNEVWQVYVNGGTANKATFQWRNSSTSVNKILTSTTSINNNAWHHILTVRDGENLYLYVDGVLEASATGATGTFNPALPLYLGKWDHQSHSPQTWYDGDMDDVQMWSRSLSASEAETLHSNGRPDTE